MRVQLHQHAHGQPVLAGHERADVVAESLGQHGQHAVHEIGRAGALAGLDVYGRVPAHVVRDVSDVHAQKPPASVRALARDRVVEVSRRGRVHRHAHDVAQVLALALGGERRRHVCVDVLGLGQRLGAKVRGQVVARDDALDGDVQPVRRAQPARHRDHARLAARRVGEDARRHDVTLAHAKALGARVVGQHEEVAADALVQGHHGTQRPCHAKRAHEAVARAAHHRLHLRLRLARPVMGQRHAHHVAVHALVQAALGNEERALLRHHGGGAGTRHAQHALERDVPRARGPVVASLELRPATPLGHGSPFRASPSRQLPDPATPLAGYPFGTTQRHGPCRDKKKAGTRRRPGQAG